MELIARSLAGLISLWKQDQKTSLSESLPWIEIMLSTRNKKLGTVLYIHTHTHTYLWSQYFYHLWYDILQPEQCIPDRAPLKRQRLSLQQSQLKTCELLRSEPFQDVGKFNLSIRLWNSVSKIREDSDVRKVKQEKKEERFENQPKWNEMRVVLFKI